MIKINLLPTHIRERRRVKALALLLAFLLGLEVLGFVAYLWAPVPFSLSAQTHRARDRMTKAEAAEAEVMDLEQQVKDVTARYAAKQNWVRWVEEADKVPEKWIQYFTTLNKYIPSDVVLHGLSLPSGAALTLNGSTRDMMAAMRWYLNMLRCEMVEPFREAVQFTPGAALSPGETPGPADPMAMSVTIRVTLKPEYLDLFTMRVAPPAGVAGGGRAGGMGRGRMGGGPEMGGGQGRGGGPRMGGGRGRGGARGMGGGRGRGGR